MAATTATENLSEALGEVIRSEFARTQSRDERGAKAVTAPASDPAGETAPRLPQRIAGGFQGLTEEIERRSRDWSTMVRLLEQQRLHLEAAEGDRDRYYEALGRVVPEAQESGQALKELIETTKSGDVSGDLSGQFGRTLRTLEELEAVSQALTANLIWTRTAWEQYARSVIRAQMMREEMKQGGPERP